MDGARDAGVIDGLRSSARRRHALIGVALEIIVQPPYNFSPLPDLSFALRINMYWIAVSYS